MSLIYKKGKEEATLGDMIKMFPDQWNAAVGHDTPFWLDNHITAVDLIVEITDLFDESIIFYQYEQMTSGKWLKMSEEESAYSASAVHKNTCDQEQKKAHDEENRVAALSFIRDAIRFDPLCVLFPLVFLGIDRS